MIRDGLTIGKSHDDDTDCDTIYATAAPLLDGPRVRLPLVTNAGRVHLMVKTAPDDIQVRYRDADSSSHVTTFRGSPAYESSWMRISSESRV